MPLAAVLALAAPAPARADGPPAGPEAGSLPTLAQRVAQPRDGCVKASGKRSERTPWPQAFLRPDAVWPLSEGAGVTVAVVGSGVDGASGDLEGRLTAGPRLSGPGDSTRDCVGHGTFLAALIAARPRTDVGFAGIAPRARVLAVGVTDDTGATDADLLARGIRAAADAGARVIAVAVPLPGPDGGPAEAVAYARGKGALLVAPAGYDGQGRTEPAPARPAPGALTVAALSPDGTPAEPGPAAGRPDLLAPGVAVMGTGPGGRGHFTASGPSCAAAFVAGTAALVLGYRPGLTVDQLESRLKATSYRAWAGPAGARTAYAGVDPVAAVTAELPGEAAGTVAPVLAPAALPPLPAAPGHPAAGQGLAVAGGAAALVAAVAAAAVVVPRGRRRSWRPGPS
ncbi:S8 family serine peptidase [Streptomyces sp. WAC06614]|uniref:S8 family serine peptidase n=1 Tax=Streptomyces sp. WAC06614 TaxID=2487416 RepID=UPI00163CE5D6|nr:S8 family serine peptidase [Streptomyces sp. WAC06614]